MKTSLALAVVFAIALAAPAPSRADETAVPAPAAATPATPATPALGSTAPDFTLESSSGKKVKLSKLRGKTVVLYFYPKDETPGCTKEACDFRDHHAALHSAGVVLLGVSVDDVASHRRFVAKEHLPFPLLADPTGDVCRAYGVLRQREKDGQTFTYAERTTFVIGKDGTVARVWPKVSVDGHVADVLAFVRGS